MKKFLLTIFCLSSLAYVRAQTSSVTNLPIVRINTNGVTILDEPKITADMQIMWVPGAALNSTTDTDFNYNGKIGIERRGSTSQQVSPKKPYSIELRTTAGLDTSVAILGMPKEEDWALVAPYSDKTLLRDALMYHLGGQIFPYAPRTRFVEVILNNAYQGIYVATEKIKRDKNRVDISKIDPLTTTGDALTGGYILKIDKTTGAANTSFASRISNNGAGNNKTQYQFHYPDAADMNWEQKFYIENFIHDFETAMNSPTYTDTVNGYRRYINDTSFVDFMLMNELARNVDGYRLSSFLYKDKNSVDGRLRMGPLWDFNIGLGNANYCNGQRTDGRAFQFNIVCPTDGLSVPFYWQKLFDAPRYRALMKARWRALRSNQLLTVKINAAIDSMSNLLTQGATTRNFQKWNILNTAVWPNPQANGSYNGEITYLKNWLQARLIWLDGAIDQISTTSTGGGLLHSKEQLTVFPNPSPQVVQFQYYLSVEQEVKLEIFNNLGQLIDYQEFKQPEGVHKMAWDAKNVGNGFYFYRMYKRGEFWKAGKIVIEK